MANKKRFNLEELVAYEHAYGGSLTRKRQLQLIGFPVAILGAFGYVLTLHWQVALALAIVGVIGGYLWLLPRQVRENYFEQGYIQRNLLINQLSQSMLDESRTYDRALIIARDSIEGSVNIEDDDYNELKHDLDVLIGQLVLRPNKERTKDVFASFVGKYAYDENFALFFEQIETKVREGYVNENVLEELMKQHNATYELQLNYNRGMNAKKREFQLISVIMAGVLWFTASQVMATMGESVKSTYFDGVLGWSVAVIFAVLYGMLMLFFYRKYFDRNIMALSASRNGLVRPYEVRPFDEQQVAEIKQYQQRPLNRFAIMLRTKNEHKLMRKLNFSVVDEINYQRKRVFQAFIGLLFGVVLASSVHAWWAFTLPVIFPIAVYAYGHKRITDELFAWTLNREVAFAKFIRLLTPYLLQGTSMNPYRLFEQIGLRLNANSDREMVFQLLESIRRHPNSEQPYTDFARVFSGNPRAVTYMSSIYGVLNTNGNPSVIQTLARQADEEFTDKVKQIADMKLNKLGVISTLTFLAGLIPLFGMVGSLLFIVIKPLFDGGLGF